MQSGIVGVWLCLVLILVYRNYISGAEISPLQKLSGDRFKTGEEWFGIYIQNQKIGYMETSSEKIGDEYRFSQYGEVNIAKEGKNIITRTRFRCLTDLQYRIKSFEFETGTGKTYFKSNGELDKDNMLLVFTETQDQKRTRTEKIDGQAYLPATIKKMMFAQGLEKGKRFRIPVLNIFTLNVEDTIVEVMDLIPVKAGINVNTAYLLKIGETFSWISDRGSTLKEQYPSGFLYFAETEDMAKSQDNKPIFDFLSLPALRSDKQLSHPDNLSRLKIRLSGVDVSEYPLLNEGRQVLNGNILEINKEDMETLKENTYELPYRGEDKHLDTYLAPSAFVQSDHHTVIYNAGKFVLIEKDAFSMARYLTSNLYMTIRKRPVFPISSTMDIFKSHAGGSNEHAVMFASFARAAGLPTRIVGGLVYLKGYFYYQTWPEAWLGRWVPADPSMGQFPADVTHIRLMEGDIDKLTTLIDVIRNMKVDIMEAQ